MDLLNSIVDDHIDETIRNYEYLHKPFTFDEADYEGDERPKAVLCPNCKSDRDSFELIKIVGKRM